MLTPPFDLESLLEQVAGERQEGLTMAGQLVACNRELLDVELRACQVDWNGQPHVAVLLRRPATTLDNRTDLHPTAVSVERCDPLTGLADRAALLSRLESDLRSRASNPGFALLFIDLDHFKQVNDAHGHLTGDHVLRDVAERLTQCVRGDDYVFRYGGDEFVVLVQRVADAEETKPIVDRIHAALAEPITLPDGEITLAVSIGVAVALSKHQSAEDLLAEADRAMYASKRDGR